MTPALQPGQSKRRNDTSTILLLSLLAILAWDASGWDVPLAQWMGSPEGFALKDSFWLSVVLHDWAKKASLALALAFVMGIVWPWGPLRSLIRAERIWLVLTMLACSVAISTIKQFSQTSCPWDLSLFGGAADYVSHWRWGVADGGAGRCFPAGHASAALAFLPLAWVMRARSPSPRAAAWVCAGILLAGLMLGLVQQWRGAHFMSHTLWTAWLCATISAVSWQCIGQRLRRQDPRQAPQLSASRH